ncbi:MAG TPA: HAD-IA family hydrolase, partial [Mariniflexile sp.]
SKAKPDPEVFLIGAKKLNMPPKSCIVFEDAIAGIEAANIVNMISVGVGDKEILKEADFNFNSLTEIPEDFFSRFLSEKIKK